MATSIPVSDFLAHFQDYKVRLGQGESFSLCEDGGQPLAEVRPAPKVPTGFQRPPPGALRHLIGDLSRMRDADVEIQALFDEAVK